MEEDPQSVFDFPLEDDQYCQFCGCLLDYHEQLEVCYECEMMYDEIVEECFTDDD